MLKNKIEIETMHQSRYTQAKKFQRFISKAIIWGHCYCLKSLDRASILENLQHNMGILKTS